MARPISPILQARIAPRTVIRVQENQEATGRVYPTIADAITYINANPDLYHIVLEDPAYAENITLPSGCHLSGRSAGNNVGMPTYQGAITMSIGSVSYLVLDGGTITVTNGQPQIHDILCYDGTFNIGGTSNVSLSNIRPAGSAGVAVLVMADTATARIDNSRFDQITTGGTAVNTYNCVISTVSGGGTWNNTGAKIKTTTNGLVATEIQGILDEITQPYVTAYRSSALNLDVGNTDVVFNTEKLDTNGWYNTSTGIFLPNKPGYYRVRARLRINNAANDTFGTLQLTNGAGSTTYDSFYVQLAATFAYSALVDKTLSFNGTTDSVKIVFNADDQAGSAGADAAQTWLQVSRI